MKRLTIRNSDGRAGFAGSGSPTENTLRIPMMLERLAEYEDAEEQGLLVRLPCKVGETVYSIAGGIVLEYELQHVVCCTPVGNWYQSKGYMTDDALIGFGGFGRTVFTSREAAEKALEE